MSLDNKMFKQVHDQNPYLQTFLEEVGFTKKDDKQFEFAKAEEDKSKGNVKMLSEALAELEKALAEE